MQGRVERKERKTKKKNMMDQRPSDLVMNAELRKVKLRKEIAELEKQRSRVLRATERDEEDHRRITSDLKHEILLLQMERENIADVDAFERANVESKVDALQDEIAELKEELSVFYEESDKQMEEEEDARLVSGAGEIDHKASTPKRPPRAALAEQYRKEKLDFMTMSAQAGLEEAVGVDETLEEIAILVPALIGWDVDVSRRELALEMERGQRGGLFDKTTVTEILDDLKSSLPDIAALILKAGTEKLKAESCTAPPQLINEENMEEEEENVGNATAENRSGCFGDIVPVCSGENLALRKFELQNEISDLNAKRKAGVRKQDVERESLTLKEFVLRKGIVKLRKKLLIEHHEAKLVMEDLELEKLELIAQLGRERLAKTRKEMVSEFEAARHALDEEIMHFGGIVAAKQKLVQDCEEKLSDPPIVTSFFLDVDESELKKITEIVQGSVDKVAGVDEAVEKTSKMVAHYVGMVIDIYQEAIMKRMEVEKGGGDVFDERAAAGLMRALKVSQEMVTEAIVKPLVEKLKTVYTTTGGHLNENFTPQHPTSEKKGEKQETPKKTSFGGDTSIDDSHVSSEPPSLLLQETQVGWEETEKKTMDTEKEGRGRKRKRRRGRGRKGKCKF